MTLQLFTAVLNPLSVGVAIVTGSLFGLLGVGWFASNPVYSSGLASEIRVATLTVAMTVFAGLVFYAGQTAATYLFGDPMWTRVASRYIVWLVFATSIGCGTYARMRRARALRRRHAHDRAIDELHTR